MKPVRVLVANHPRLMREHVVSTIANQADIEIVGELADGSGIQDAVAALRPDWIVITLEESGNLSPQFYDLLEEYPQTKILGISTKKNSATLCWASLIVHSNRMEPTQKNLLGALRGKPQFVRNSPPRSQLFR
jgi:chemotaxis response regulator CheB